MKQQCYLLAVWLTWLGLPALALIFGFSQGWPAGVFVLLVGVLGQVAYLRWFPRISRWVGYGSVADVRAEAVSLSEESLRVTFYTANVCPFCPIMRERLMELKRALPFELAEVDVTFRPQVVCAKGLRSVPVIEASGRFLVGNATSAELAEFLTQGSMAKHLET